MFRLMFLMVCHHVMWNQGKQLSVTSHRNKMLHDHSLRNISNTKMTECLQYCLSDCLCQSFQICDQECQLCSSNKYLTPSDWADSPDCIAFEFWDNAPMEKEFIIQHCGQHCMPLNCCLTSNPCLNGGKCEVAKQNSDQRFTCKCPDEYHGYRCEECKPGYKGENCDKPIRSCRGYSGKHRGIGLYTVVSTDSNKTYKVFCAFSTNMAWTLIQSYSLENKDMFQNAFFTNSPKNRYQPTWKEYRLSKSQLQDIMLDSTNWRFTCNYDRNGLRDYKDYVLGLNTELDIRNFNDTKCVLVEYVNVRGWGCTNCWVSMEQSVGIPLHVSLSHNGSCKVTTNMVLERCGLSGGDMEDNFGYYDCVNTKHRCSSSPLATTQAWVGG